MDILQAIRFPCPTLFNGKFIRSLPDNNISISYLRRMPQHVIEEITICLKHQTLMLVKPKADEYGGAGSQYDGKTILLVEIP